MKALISYEGIYRKETYFFPKDAFRELLLNAAIHKDYLSTTPIQIRIYKDKIRLWNDGALPKEVSVDSLYKEHVSKPCNPNLANVFFKCGMIESWARGFEKITAYCKEYKAKLPVIDLSLGGITARCFASDSFIELMNEHNIEMSNKMSNKMSNRDQTRLRIVVEYLKKNGSIKKSEAAELLDIEDKTAQRLLAKAVKLNILENIGEYKTSIYKLK